MWCIRAEVRFTHQRGCSHKWQPTAALSNFGCTMQAAAGLQQRLNNHHTTDSDLHNVTNPSQDRRRHAQGALLLLPQGQQRIGTMKTPAYPTNTLGTSNPTMMCSISHRPRYPLPKLQQLHQPLAPVAHHAAAVTYPSRCRPFNQCRCTSVARPASHASLRHRSHS